MSSCTAHARVFSLQDVIAGQLDLPVVARRLRPEDEEEEWSDDSGTESQNGDEELVLLHAVRTMGDLIEVFDKLGQNLLAEIHTNDTTYVFEVTGEGYHHDSELPSAERLQGLSESIHELDVYDCLADLLAASKGTYPRRILVVEAPVDGPEDFLRDDVEIVLACEPRLDIRAESRHAKVPCWVLGDRAINGNLEIRLAYVSLTESMRCLEAHDNDRSILTLAYIMRGMPNSGIVRAIPYPVIRQNCEQSRSGARLFMRPVTLRKKTLVVASSETSTFALWCNPAPQQVRNFQEVHTTSPGFYRNSCRQLAEKLSLDDIDIWEGHAGNLKRRPSYAPLAMRPSSCKCNSTCLGTSSSSCETSRGSKRAPMPKLRTNKWSLAYVPERKPKPLAHHVRSASMRLTRRTSGKPKATVRAVRPRRRQNSYIEVIAQPEVVPVSQSSEDELKQSKTEREADWQNETFGFESLLIRNRAVQTNTRCSPLSGRSSSPHPRSDHSLPWAHGEDSSNSNALEKETVRTPIKSTVRMRLAIRRAGGRRKAKKAGS